MGRIWKIVQQLSLCGQRAQRQGCDVYETCQLEYTSAKKYTIIDYFLRNQQSKGTYNLICANTISTLMQSV